MIELAIFFFIVAVIAGALGFTGIARGAAKIAKVLFFIFLGLFLLVVILAFLGIAAVA